MTNLLLKFPDDDANGQKQEKAGEENREEHEQVDMRLVLWKAGKGRLTNGDEKPVTMP